MRLSVYWLNIKKLEIGNPDKITDNLGEKDLKSI